MNGEMRTILVYAGLELMGDGFMKIPFLRALRGTWPEARITWLAGRGRTVYAGALAPLAAPYLDEVIEQTGFASRLADLLRRPLPDRRFDLVIDTQRGVRTCLALRRIRHGLLISGAADFHLSDRRPTGRYRKPAAMVQQLLDLLRILLRHEPALAPPPPLAERFEAAARTALPDGSPQVGLVPGAGGRQKCWPLERYMALARHCLTRGRRPAFVLGPDERAWLDALRAAVPEACFPLQDPAIEPELARSPLFTVAVGRRLSLAVANDCGTAHMLAAAETPLISLFGPSEAAKFAPATPRLTIIRAQDFGAQAMHAIPFEAVAAALDAALARSA